MVMEKRKIDVLQAIEVHFVPDAGPVKGWLHSHGMAKHGQPELEIRNIPLFCGEMMQTSDSP